MIPDPMRKSGNDMIKHRIQAIGGGREEADTEPKRFRMQLGKKEEY